ncbi:MAG: hypothetical protein IJ688_00450 [Treponema sp.]|nr:hypothetical protein [Treponema sp.]
MNAFISLQNYIVKQEKDFGVGVPVTLSEEIAKYESTRKKNVASFNNWMMINIPGKPFFLDIAKPVTEQSDDILNILMSKDFLMSLFIHEARNTLNEIGKNLEGKDVREETNRIYDEFVKEKYESLLKFQSGQELFNFVVSKCNNKNKAKSSALLYNFGIKGALFNDNTGERFLMFNAKKDIIPIELRKDSLVDSKLIL